MNNNIEIERKFILRRLPLGIDDKSVRSADLTNYYIDEHNRVSKSSENKYSTTRKNPVKGLLVREERTCEISKKEYNDLVKQGRKVIKKKRYYIHDDYGQTWHIDNYQNITLISAECEVIGGSGAKEDLKGLTIDEILPIIFPPFIEDEIITEVTNEEQFYNYNLAIPI